jgi:hypothetical protein
MALTGKTAEYFRHMQVRLRLLPSDHDAAAKRHRFDHFPKHHTSALEKCKCELFASSPYPLAAAKGAATHCIEPHGRSFRPG